MLGHWYGFGAYGMGMAMWIGWLLILVVVAVVVVLLLRGSSSNTPQRGSRAREILEERYARGEISTEEYRERAAELDRR